MISANFKKNIERLAVMCMEESGRDNGMLTRYLCLVFDRFQKSNQIYDFRIDQHAIGKMGDVPLTEILVSIKPTPSLEIFQFSIWRT